ESLSRSIHLLQPQHFLTPFLAHALGTLVGATVPWLVAVSHRMRLAYVIGGRVLIGGTAAVMMIPAPTWFIVLDLLVAYIPLAWLGGRIGAAIRPAPVR